MASTFRPFAKGAVQVVLMITLIKYFGVPSWERYQEEKTVVTSAEKNLGAIPAPMVTVCPVNPETMLGLKNSSLRMENFPNFEFVFELCKGLKEEDIIQCVEKNTFSFSEIVEHASKGFVGENFTEARFWGPEFSMSAVGICFQLDANLTLGTKQITDMLLIKLKARKAFLLVHDPHFFILNSNPGFPLNFKTIDTMKTYSFQLVQHNNLDLASKPCNSDPLYSFTRCIKTSLSREVGCRLHWDRWTQLKLKKCNQLEQYRWREVPYDSTLEICMFFYQGLG